MPASIVEQIAVAIKTQLDTVTIANGYEITLTSVTRPTRLGGYSPLDKAVVLKQLESPSRDREADADGAVPSIAWRQTFTVIGFVVPSSTASGAVDTELNAMRSSLEKALLATPQWGGLAIDTTLDQPSYEQADNGEFEAVIVRVEVLYRVLENDPYTNAL